MMRTSPTPGRLSIGSFTFFSAISVSSRRSRGPETARNITGVLSGSNFSTIGGSVSSGNCATMVPILSRTSCAASSRLRSKRNSTMTLE